MPRETAVQAVQAQHGDQQGVDAEVRSGEPLQVSRHQHRPRRGKKTFFPTPFSVWHLTVLLKTEPVAWPCHFCSDYLIYTSEEWGVEFCVDCCYLLLHANVRAWPWNETEFSTRRKKKSAIHQRYTAGKKEISEYYNTASLDSLPSLLPFIKAHEVTWREKERERDITSVIKILGFPGHFSLSLGENEAQEKCLIVLFSPCLVTAARRGERTRERNSVLLFSSLGIPARNETRRNEQLSG